MLSTYAGYESYARQPATSLARIAAQPAVSHDTTYYQANIGKVKSVDDLLGNARLYTYAMTSFGLEDAVPNRGFMRKVLTSDLSDPNSFANKLTDPRYRTMAAAYAFSTKGTVASTAIAQDTAQEDDTLGLYSQKTASGAAQTADISYYQSHIGQVTSVGDLEADPRLLRIALKAYGIDPTAEPMSSVTALLEHGAPAAAAVAGGPDLNAFASDFNFDANGKAAAPLLAQSVRDATSTLARYARTATAAGAGTAQIQKESTYYATAIEKVRTVDGFLSDPRLVAVATAAAGVTRPAGLSDAAWTARLRSALTSDLSDPKSAANTLGGAYRTLAAAFSFARDGSATRAAAQQVQSAGAAALLADAHTEQIMEDQAQAADPNVALALYFKRQAPTISSPYSILADKKLLSFTETLLGLPADFSKLGIDAQAGIITSKMKLKDLSDPKKLDTLVQRFAIQADLAKAKATPPSTPFDGIVGGTTIGGDALLGTLHPQTSTAAGSILQLFASLG